MTALKKMTKAAERTIMTNDDVKTYSALQDGLRELKKDSELFKRQIDEAQETANRIDQNLTAVMGIAKSAFPEAYKAYLEKKGGEDA